jgi:outer membrane lipoprotein-sorting protein
MDGSAFMNWTRQYGSLVGVAVTIIFCCGWTGSWRDIEQAASNIQSIRADFVQERHLEILQRPLISKGRFYYRRPDALRWEYETPIRSILLVHGSRMKRYAERDGGLVPETGPGVDAMQFVTAEMTRWFEGRFRQAPYFEAEMISESGDRIRLRPKQAAMSKMIRHIDVTFSDTPGIIESVTVFEEEKSFIQLMFKQVEVNRTLPDRLFEDAE